MTITFPKKTLLLFSLASISFTGKAQNIYSALHLNDQREYKTVKPKKIIETNTFYNTNGTEVKKALKVLDDAGMLVREDRTDEDDKLTDRCIIINDTINKIKLWQCFERWGRLGHTKEITDFGYDSTHFLIRITSKNEKGDIFNYYKIENNTEGDPISINAYSFNGTFIGREVATYFYDKNSMTNSVIRDDGQILSTNTSTIRPDKTIAFADKSNYNAHGDPLSYVTQNFNGTENLYECKYTYDSKGNCTEETIYKITTKSNGKRKQQIDRNFKKEYFY